MAIENVSVALIDTTVQLKDVITWGITVIGFIGTAVWIKLTVLRHHAILFDSSGEIRVVTYAALERKEKECKERRSLESNYAGSNMQHLADEIRKLVAEVAQLSKCVAILAHGGKADDC